MIEKERQLEKDMNIADTHTHTQTIEPILVGSDHDIVIVIIIFG